MRTLPARRFSPTRAQKSSTSVSSPATSETTRSGSSAVALAPARKQLAELLERPVHDAVGGVVQHLPDHLPSDPGVGAALDLDERRHRVLVEEQVVDGPAAGRVFVVRERSLTTNQQPAARECPPSTGPREQARKPRDQRLQYLLGLIRALAHLDKLVVASQQKDPAAHASNVLASAECNRRRGRVATLDQPISAESPRSIQPSSSSENGSARPNATRRSST